MCQVKEVYCRERHCPRPVAWHILSHCAACRGAIQASDFIFDKSPVDDAGPLSARGCSHGAQIQQRQRCKYGRCMQCFALAIGTAMAGVAPNFSTEDRGVQAAKPCLSLLERRRLKQAGKTAGASRIGVSQEVVVSSSSTCNGASSFNAIGAVGFSHGTSSVDVDRSATSVITVGNGTDQQHLSSILPSFDANVSFDDFINGGGIADAMLLGHNNDQLVDQTSRQTPIGTQVDAMSSCEPLQQPQYTWNGEDLTTLPDATTCPAWPGQSDFIDPSLLDPHCNSWGLDSGGTDFLSQLNQCGAAAPVEEDFLWQFPSDNGGFKRRRAEEEEDNDGVERRRAPKMRRVGDG